MELKDVLKLLAKQQVMSIATYGKVYPDNSVVCFAHSEHAELYFGILSFKWADFKKNLVAADDPNKILALMKGISEKTQLKYIVIDTLNGVFIEIY